MISSVFGISPFASMGAFEVGEFEDKEQNKFLGKSHLKVK